MQYDELGEEEAVAGDETTDMYPHDEHFEDKGTFYYPDVESPVVIGARSGNRGVPVPRSAAIRKQAASAFPAPKQRVKSKTKKVKRHSNRIIVKEKQRRALEARKMGATYQKIAEALGYTHASAARKAVLKAYDEIIQEDTEELRTLQMERYNDMLTRVWNRVAAGDDMAIRTALSIMDRMDAIKGTLAPQKIESKNTNAGAILVVDGDRDDYINALRKMAGVDRDGNNSSSPHQIDHQENLPQLPAGRVYPPGMEPKDEDEGDDGAGDIIEAEVVEDREQEEVIPAQPTKKKFNFSVEPTARREK